MWAACLTFWLASSAPLVLAVGVNHPAQLDIKPLQFADDDAVAAAGLFGVPPSDVWLLADLDEDTQQRAGPWTARALPPTLNQLQAAVKRMAARVEQRQAQGEPTQVFIWLMGHGDFDAQGRPVFGLADALLTQQALMADVVAPLLGAQRVHLLVDACHAQALVQYRARLVKTDAVPPEQRTWAELPARPTNLGIVVAARATQQTFEWQDMRAGIFSALVRSGLRGAANANGDNQVSYPELGAYVMASLQGITAADARPTLVWSAPPQDQNAALASSDWFVDHAAWTTQPADRGAIRVEDEQSSWLAGGLFEPQHTVTLWVPRNIPLVLRDAAGAHPVHASADGVVVGPVDEPLTQARGVSSATIARGLFSIPYGPAFYRGYEAALPAVTAPTPEAPRPSASEPSSTRVWPRLLVVSSGPGWLLGGALALLGTAAGVGATVFWIQYAATNIQKNAYVAGERAVPLTWVALGLGGLAVPLLVTAAALVLLGWIFR